MFRLDFGHGLTYSLGCCLPLQGVNVDAPPAASAALCRHMCLPRLALKCAALREAVAFMGYTGDEGAEVGVRCSAVDVWGCLSQSCCVNGP